MKNIITVITVIFLGCTLNAQVTGTPFIIPRAALPTPPGPASSNTSGIYCPNTGSTFTFNTAGPQSTATYTGNGGGFCAFFPYNTADPYCGTKPTAGLPNAPGPGGGTSLDPFIANNVTFDHPVSNIGMFFSLYVNNPGSSASCTISVVATYRGNSVPITLVADNGTCPQYSISGQNLTINVLGVLGQDPGHLYYINVGGSYFDSLTVTPIAYTNTFGTGSVGHALYFNNAVAIP